MRPPITYYGGKQKLAGDLCKLIPEHRLYIEPFMGGGALFFRKEPSEAEIINDLNGNVTNFYRVVQTQFEELKKLIDGTLHSRATYKQALEIYNNPPNADNELGDPLCAWAFWVVTNQGFGGKIGSWALSRDGKIGRTLAGKREEFSERYAQRLKHVQIESKDAIEVIEQYDKEDAFFYLDPPYFNSDCGHYKGYTQSEYIKLLEKLVKVKGKFLLSSYPSDVLSDFIGKEGWEYREKKQRVSVTRLSKKEKTEVMVHNYGVPTEAVSASSTITENKKPSLTVRPVQNIFEMCKQAGEEKVVDPVKYNGKESLHLAEIVPCFGLEENSPMQNKTRTAKSLEFIHDSKQRMRGEENDYYVLGSISHDMGSLFITLMIEERASGRRERTKVDLYEREQVKQLAIDMGEQLMQVPEDIEKELSRMTDLLEQYRDRQMTELYPVSRNRRNTSLMPPEVQKASIGFLREPNLIERIDKLIEQSGVVGEKNTRRLLFIVASTYKMKEPLHVLVHGTSGSGKSHLINAISNCMPPEDVMSMTRVTSKSFYHYNKDELVDKLMLIQDYDGLDEEAQFAFRELQSAGIISSSTTYKDRNGNIVSMMKTVKSHFASMLATTKAEVYYDNLSRSVATGVDESEEQTERIIKYQNRKLAGHIDEKEERKAREQLQNIIRCIKPMEVINPYADKISLPVEAKMLRRLNTHYHSFVRQVTLLHQYQRKKDALGRLISEPEDLKIACDILFDAIMLKVDDLDTTLRQFFDRMKEYIGRQVKEVKKDKETLVFTQREVRLALNISKTQCFRYMEDLELLEYVQRTGGYANRGFKYKIVYWDDMSRVRERIKTELGRQLDVLKNKKNKVQ